MTASHPAPADVPAAGIGTPGFDRILEVSPGVRAEALLNVTGTLPFFDSHFPRRPILPGVLLTESMIALAVLAAGDPLLRLRAAEGLRFRRFVTPGDQVHITVEKVSADTDPAESVWRAAAKVDGKLVAAIKNLRLVRGPIAAADGDSAAAIVREAANGLVPEVKS
ncbi:3-hydroxyacyl-ACP dehydratase FabZ family protein [Nocardia tengchongensis]|uniref:3-hydroxyacyl-ACP dehydratase FabZ family protein n=1 Tax=Nocardia tengchongensis TaxID=2055889 RepID=UPI0036115B8E